VHVEYGQLYGSLQLVDLVGIVAAKVSLTEGLVQFSTWFEGKPAPSILVFVICASVDAMVRQVKVIT
jgi:hypothetical protein